MGILEAITVGSAGFRPGYGSLPTGLEPLLSIPRPPGLLWVTTFWPSWRLSIQGTQEPPCASLHTKLARPTARGRDKASQEESGGENTHRARGENRFCTAPKEVAGVLHDLVHAGWHLNWRLLISSCMLRIPSQAHATCLLHAAVTPQLCEECGKNR